jgi:hypothetical protein
MIVTLIDVSQPQSVKTQRGSYQSLEVSYRNESGQVQGKKLMSFANPAVFKEIQEFAKDDRLDIETFKDDNGYWQWKNIAKEGEAPPKASTGGKANTRVTGSNYETSDERAKRQVYIVRQSSISNAVDLLTASGKGVKVDEVLSVAKQFEDYVFGNPSSGSAKSIDDLEDDIPV